MIDEKTIIEQSKLFEKKGNAYVHMEITDGDGKTVLAGDPINILFGTANLIRKIAEITETPAKDIINDLERLLCDVNTEKGDENP